MIVYVRSKSGTETRYIIEKMEIVLQRSESRLCVGSYQSHFRHWILNESFESDFA